MELREEPSSACSRKTATPMSWLRPGPLIPGDPTNNDIKEEVARRTNPEGKRMTLQEALEGADVFIGVSAANTLSQDMVRGMADKPIIMALANPEPEIPVDLALEAGAAVVATGRSDYPNQINNVLGFPGIFRGALDVRAKDINDEMKIAAAYAIADLVENPTADYIIPSPFDERVAPAVAKAVAETAKKTGASWCKSMDWQSSFDQIIDRVTPIA